MPRYSLGFGFVFGGTGVLAFPRLEHYSVLVAPLHPTSSSADWICSGSGLVGSGDPSPPELLVSTARILVNIHTIGGSDAFENLLRRKQGRRVYLSSA